MAKTIRQQIADLETKIGELQAKKTVLQVKADQEVNFDHIVPGAVIQFPYGKGEGRKVVQGTVAGVQLADPAQPKSAPMARVAIGEGFNAQLVTVYFAVVEAVISSPARPASEVEVEQAAQ